MKIFVSHFLLTLALYGASIPGALFGATPDRVDFNFHVKPILSDRCYACHGPDEENRQGGFRFDVKESALGEADSGARPIVPGDASASEIIARLTSEEPSMRMPPADSKLTVSQAEIELIRKWIDQGAEWEAHWSFLPVSPAKPPRVTNADWPKNKIDRYVMAVLEEKGLKPSPKATKEQLIRRVYYDLTGLPPTVEEVEAFVKDHSDDAYEKLVDRLLASPRYGERVAVDWLDVARYADTYGYQADKYRAMWSWRDWVVRAFNENLPHDKFITWQLAGDLLPDATDEQILATAFNRLHRQTNEGGSIEEEFRVEYVVDRVDTFGTAFLGLTIQCARCHDHKFDPITQQDYYQLFAYFDNIDESGLYSHFTSAVPSPTLLEATVEQKEHLAEVDRQISEAEARLDEIAQAERDRFESLLAEGKLRTEITGLVGHFEMEEMVNGKVENLADAENGAKVEGDVELVPGRIGQALHLSGENKFSSKVGGQFTRDDPFTISLWIKIPEVMDRAVIWHRSQAWTDAGSRGYELLIENGKLNAALIHFWPGNAISVRTRREMPIGRWQQVTVTYDGSSRAAGVRIYVNGQLEPVDVVRDHLTKTVNYYKRARANNEGDLVEVNELTVGQRFRDRGFKNGLVDDLRVYNRELTALEVGHLSGDPLSPSTEYQGGGTVPTNGLLEWYLHNQCAEYRQALDELKKARAAKSTLLDEIPEIMVMREMPQKRQTFLLARGAYDAPTTPVSPETPSGLPKIREDFPKNRLGLAQWLVDSQNPLTARVAVNRFWQSLFGQGLVSTSNDFGSQGQLPTHPELLDYLAHWFVESGWDVKALMKLIVMSATYQQSSDCPPALSEEDPTNQWLARGPRHRLPAEMIRDTALYQSGLLIEKLGGPPVKPYEPAGLWEEKGSESYQRDKGPGSHRRSLYTFWKRTSPPPAMITLDAADREVCIVQRQTTATPLQALVLLNDPQYVEAARAAAEKVLHGQQETAGERIKWLFRAFTSREPTSDETKLLERLFEDQLSMFRSDTESTEAFLAVGDHRPEEKIDSVELAAMAVVAQTIMNHYDTVTKQ